ncbi:MAG: 4a-hydroxytetrahydrobiopterin dehydratase [Myxococcota bacterium]
MSELATRKCVPCRSGVPPLQGEALEALHAQLEPGWEIMESHHIRKLYRFPDFASALAFVNRVGQMAEELGHHPDLQLSWGKVLVEIWTHKIGGLHEADFVFAARCDKLQRQS